MAATAPQIGLRRHLVACALLAGLAFAAWHVAFDAEFLLDDWDNIVHNPYDRWTELSVRNALGAMLGPAVRRPVAHLSFGLNHYFAGYDPRAFRIPNVALHAVNGALVYAFSLLVLRRLRRARPEARPALAPGSEYAVALLAGLLFVAHPLQIQSVTYVVQRMTSLATCFYLIALWLWLRSSWEAVSSAQRRWLRAGACAAGLLALGSKEIAVMLPFAVWLCEGCFSDEPRRHWLQRRAAPIALASLAFFALLGFQSVSPEWQHQSFTVGEKLLSAPRVLCFYLSLIALPLPSRLNLLHVLEPSHSLLDPVTTLPAALAIAALSALCLASVRRFPVAAFGGLWFFLHVVLEASTLPLRLVFEHRLYLPLAGVAFATAVLLFGALGERRRLAALLGTLLVGALGAATWTRNAVYADSRALWVDAAAKSPGDWLARMLHAGVLAQDGRHAEALEEAVQASALEPESPRPHALRGAVLAALGRDEEAIAAYRTAASLSETDALSRESAALLLDKQGRLDEAAQLLMEALAAQPDERFAFELGQVRERQGLYDEALSLYQESARRNLRYAEPRAAAGLLQGARGRHAEAAFLLEEALALRDDPELHVHLANQLWALGKTPRAIAELETSLRQRPEWALAQNNLAWILATAPDPALRDGARALALVEAALVAAPEDADLLDTLAVSQAALGRYDAALATSARAAAAARSQGNEARALEIETHAAAYREQRPYVEAPPAAGAAEP
jgi:tetratricopeptide (TPR) repeat protein